MRLSLPGALIGLGVGLSLPGLAAAQDIPDALFDRAEADGVVRVIAHIAVPYQPERALAAPEVETQRAEIASAQADLARALDDVGTVEALGDLPLAVVETDAEGLAALAESGLVVAVVEDALAEPLLVQSGPLIAAPDAWNAGFSGAGQTVAVLDTGIETTHPAFAGKIVAQACFSTTSAANGGSTSFCPNGAAEQVGGVSGRDCPASVSGCGHGTHVAGIAVGKGGNVVGVAQDASAAPYQVFSRFASQATCGNRPAPCALSYTSDQIKALQHVASLAGNFSIAAVNMSLGGGKSAGACDGDPRKPVIDQLRALGIATVVATGNDGFSDGIGFPACISTAIAVGSTTKSDALSGFSNSAPTVDLLAPGSGITSAVLGGGTGPLSGTSMATPHVAGAFAVARSADPGASVTTILSELKANGHSVTGKGVTRPRIHLAYIADKAVAGDIGPVAFGTLWFDGTKQSGTPNWTATFNPTFNRYEISIARQSYYYLDYATEITAAGDVRFCRSSSVGGKLLVYCMDADGRPATSRFSFVTYRN